MTDKDYEISRLLRKRLDALNCGLNSANLFPAHSDELSASLQYSNAP